MNRRSLSPPSAGTPALEPVSDLVPDFLVRTLVAAGGVVEDTADGLDALLPSAAARRLDLPEEIEIKLFSAETTPGGKVLDGRIGSVLLERLVTERLERPAIAAVGLPASRNPADLPEDLPVLLNAVRMGPAERRRMPGRFLAAEVRVTLHGEELRSELVTLDIRLEDGARTEPFSMSGARPVAAARLDEGERRNAAAALRSWLRREGPSVHAGALETLRRRAHRDLDRMADYYASLDAEMARAAERARSANERSRRYAKWAALPADLDTRREQLRVRIRPRLAARVVAATLIETAVDRFDVPVRRRSRQGTLTVYRRMTDGRFEGPVCAACGRATLRLFLCDDRLHVLCDACGQDGRLDAARCRACGHAPPEPPTIVIEDPTTRLRIGAPDEIPPQL